MASTGPEEAFEEDRPGSRPARSPERPPDDNRIQEGPTQRRPQQGFDERRHSYPPPSSDPLSSLIPYNNGKALAAYYMGVFSLIPCVGLVLGVIAIVFGILGLKFAKANPSAKGGGHAIAGIVLGAIGFGYQFIFVVLFGIGILLAKR